MYVPVVCMASYFECVSEPSGVVKFEQERHGASCRSRWPRLLARTVLEALRRATVPLGVVMFAAMFLLSVAVSGR